MLHWEQRAGCWSSGAGGPTPSGLAAWDGLQGRGCGREGGSPSCFCSVSPSRLHEGEGFLNWNYVPSAGRELLVGLFIRSVVFWFYLVIYVLLWIIRLSCQMFGIWDVFNKSALDTGLETEPWRRWLKGVRCPSFCSLWWPKIHNGGN